MAIQNEEKIWKLVDAKKEDFIELSDRVFDTPETLYNEFSSVSEHIATLEKEGFTITKNVCGMPTAVIGEAGNEGPVIAILGEFDALPGLSQEPGVATHSPVIEGGNGHGCGHNLLGSAALLAATAVKDWLAETGIKARVRYYGCPAEEGGAAKTYMARDGLFDDVSAAISWHPSTFNAVQHGNSLANSRIDFTFSGKAAHAAAAPHLGRSALDACELMNVGVNYMREHISDRARIHYAYIDAGGISPNVVQAYANARYVVREPSVKETVKLIDRVVNVAKGAALMTETEMKWRLVTMSAELIANTPLCQAMEKNLHMLGAPDFTDVDVAYAKRFQNTLEQKDITASYSMLGLGVQRDKVLADFLPPLGHQSSDLPASTDVGDVSWVVPTVQLWGANYAIGTPYHTWQMVAQGKSSPALKGMVHAATVMAMTGVDAVLNSELREQAWADFKARVGEEGYVSALSDDAEPPIKEMAG